MTIDYEIKCSQSEFNMAAWCTEKSEYALAALARNVDSIKANPQLDQSFRDSMLSNLWYGISYTTKLLAFGCGVQWDANDPDVVFENGYHGFETLMVRYGLLAETAQGRKQKTIDHFLLKLESLLAGPRTPNRTFLHELLESGYIEHRIVQQIRSQLELVTMGQMQWQTFVENGLGFLEQLKVAAAVEWKIKNNAV